QAMQIKELLEFLKYEEVEFKPLQEICYLRAGDRIIKSMMSENEKYPVIGGGVVPTGYFKDYNFIQGITIARAGSAGYVAWQEKPFWATDVCFVATLREFCHSEALAEESHSNCRSEVLQSTTEESQQVKRDVSLAMQAQHDKVNVCHSEALAEESHSNCRSEVLQSTTEESHNIESQHTNP
ncbi:hypothetical protein CQA66_09070, partial [Helicobacter aurati]